MKTGLFAIGALAAVMGFCTEVSAGSCCCNTGCCSSGGAPETKNVAFTPQWYNMECGCGFFASAEFLYWYGKETDLSYALEGKTRNNFNNIATTYQFAADQLIYLGAKAKPGVRVGIGWMSACDGWDFYLNWTYYYNSNHRKKSVPQFALGYPSLNEYGLVNPWVSRPLFVGILFDQISAKWEFRLNTLDLELGRRYWLSRCFTLRPFTGLRAAWTTTDFDVKGSRTGFIGNYTATTSDNFTSKDQFKNSFWGIGLVGGIQPTWSFSDCFSLYGNMDIALLWGKHKVKKSEDYTNFQTAVSSGVVTQLADYSANSSSESSYLQPILDLAIGLRFEDYYCNDSYYFAIDLGWENHVLFHHNDRYLIPGNVIQYSLASGVTGEGFDHYNQTQHDISLGGIVFRVRFGF